MAQKCFAFVHSWGGKLWWPVKFWIVPCGELLLLLRLGVATLVSNMVIVVAMLVENGSFLLLPDHFGLLLRFQVLLHPVHEVLLRVTRWACYIRAYNFNFFCIFISFLSLPSPSSEHCLRTWLEKRSWLASKKIRSHCSWLLDTCCWTNFEQ